MGKLFSNSGQGPTTGSSCGGYHRGCCHGQGFNSSYNVPFAGEPCSAPTGHNMNRMCMGNCNPPKLYGDTYNYLNKNLMQPVVQEVYQDLKTINPTNTIMNNQMAGQMGLSPNNTRMQGNMGDMKQSPMSGGVPNYEHTGMSEGSIKYENTQQNMGGMLNYSTPLDNMNNMRQTNKPIKHPKGQAGNIGGMGAQIVNMMMGNGSTKPNSNMSPSPSVDTPQYLQADLGAASLNSGPYNNSMGINKVITSQDNGSPGIQNPTTQYIDQQNTYNTPNSQHFTGTNNRGYGQHNLGISKFNEMFPGVMQGGDLGFDPMSIAIQMNPANQQKAAMNSMQKMMNGNNNKGHDPAINSGFVQSTTPGGQSTNQQMMNRQAFNPNANSNQMESMQQMSNSNEIPLSSHIPQQQQQQQQQVHATRAPMSEHNPSQQMQGYQQQYQQPKNQEQRQIFDTNTGAVITSPNVNHDGDQNEQIDPNALFIQQPPSAFHTAHSDKPLPPQPLIKEPIFPVDTLKNRIPQNLKSHNYQYNTLGQPIEMTSADMYHVPEPQLPQTLSPQPVPANLRQDPVYVKNTVSKTSLIHNPVGRASSRNQLQAIYNQYKGSRSFTQQNVKGAHGMTYSDRQLNVAPGNGNSPQTHLHQVPVEKVGGDTLANNNNLNNQIPSNAQQVLGQTGDVTSLNTPTGDGAYKAESPMKVSKCRNGLQDMTYTSYPTSAAWSFHGVYPRPPISANHRYMR